MMKIREPQIGVNLGGWLLPQGYVIICPSYCQDVICTQPHQRAEVFDFCDISARFRATIVIYHIA